MPNDLKVSQPKVTPLGNNRAAVEITVSDADKEEDATNMLRIRTTIETYSEAPPQRIHLEALVEALQRLDVLQAQTLNAMLKLQGSS